jgi:hypothetical protein
VSAATFAVSQALLIGVRMAPGGNGIHPDPLDRNLLGRAAHH